MTKDAQVNTYLEQEQTKFILNDVHRVRDPRRMTVSDFDLVSEKCEALQANETP